MSDLEPRARAIIDAGRDADAPSPVDHARIKRAVLFHIAATGAAVSTAAAGTLSLGAKVGLVVLTVGVVGGGAVGLHHLQGAQPPAPAHRQVARKPAVMPVVAPLPGPESRVAATPPPVAPDATAKKPERPRRPAAHLGPPLDEDQLTAEVTVLRRAREELRLGRPTAALAALVEYDRRFGQGVLGEERQAIAAIAGCQATPGPAAKAQGEAFMRQAPRSPLRDRVREACITAGAGKSP